MLSYGSWCIPNICSTCSWSSKVWASTEKSHRALSWLGNAVFPCYSPVCWWHTLQFMNMTKDSAFSRAPMMMIGVFLEMKTTHCMISFLFSYSLFLLLFLLRYSLLNPSKFRIRTLFFLFIYFLKVFFSAWKSKDFLWMKTWIKH